MSRSPFISKSKFLQGLQCPKLIWSSYNAKHLFPKVDDALQSVFDQGHEIGAFAKRMFPNGIEIDVAPSDFESAIQLTRKHLSSRRPIFEATLSANGGYARADILYPVGKDEWNLIEVKSTTGFEPIHIPDLAFQAWVFTKAGIKIRQCFLCHINNKFVRHGEVDPKEFFTMRDVTAEVSAYSSKIVDQISEMGKTIRAAKCPDIQIGQQCKKPHKCALYERCWSFLPVNNVLELRNDKKGRGWDLLKRGILKIARIPKIYPLSEKQEIQRATVISGKPYVELKQIQSFLRKMEHPIHFLDFETFQKAVPIFDGTRPYEQIPFQFSLHIIQKAGAKPEHRKFLADGRNDPRAEFMRQLKSSVLSSGSILVFNASFEKSRLKECAAFMPKYQKWVTSLNRRIVDLEKPFSAFNYYNPKQGSRTSMKLVLPALTGKDYKGLEIQEGGAASREFIRVTFGDVTKSERKQVRKALDEYCGQDTEGMVWILDALRGVC